ncbi:hypothetical protein GCM10009563_10490 [Subtercola frigoramans]
MTDDAKPCDPFARTTALTGVSERKIFNTTTKVGERVSERRHVGIKHLDDLVPHVVEIAGLVAGGAPA